MLKLDSLLYILTGFIPKARPWGIRENKDKNLDYGMAEILRSLMKEKNFIPKGWSAVSLTP